MFGPKHYVPVLKVKRGEKRALAEVRPRLRQHVVPLLEIVERTSAPTVDKHLTTGFRDLASSLQGYPRCFLDLREIAPDGPASAAKAFRRAISEGISFTPVTGISRVSDVASSVTLSQSYGLAIRLTRAEFEGGRLSARLRRFLSVNGLSPDRVDLIVDLETVEELITAGVKSFEQAFLNEIPDKSQWRTLTVTGSAFPLSMAVVGRNSSAWVERSEWLAWRDGLYAQRSLLERLPTFSDYAIQHRAGVENFDFRFMRPSATIRYTSDIFWLLIKGESTKNTPARIQFRQLATRLVYGQLHSSFAGANHCLGCKLVKDSADGASGLGSPEVWRRIGTIHHITTVVQDDLASLQWP